MSLTMLTICHKIVKFHCHIWNHRDKCVQLSTNMPGIGSVMCEMDLKLFAAFLVLTVLCTLYYKPPGFLSSLGRMFGVSLFDHHWGPISCLLIAWNTMNAGIKHDLSFVWRLVFARDNKTNYRLTCVWFKLALFLLVLLWSRLEPALWRYGLKETHAPYQHVPYTVILVDNYGGHANWYFLFNFEWPYFLYAYADIRELLVLSYFKVS